MIFLVVVGLATGALLLMRAAALFAWPVQPGTVVAEGEGAASATPCTFRHISRSVGVRRSFLHALRAPGLLCKRVLASMSRHTALRAQGFAAPSARLRVRVVPEPG